MLGPIRTRRSIRRYTDRPVSEAHRRKLEEAVLRAPTSNNSRPWEFVFVTNRETIAGLSRLKPTGAEFLAGAPLAVAVLADPRKSTVWVEDGSIAAAFLHLAAHSLGLGSCWVQVRGREHSPGRSASGYVLDLLEAPEDLEVLAVIGVGHPDEKKPPVPEEDLLRDRIHRDRFGRRESAAAPAASSWTGFENLPRELAFERPDPEQRYRRAVPGYMRRICRLYEAVEDRFGEEGLELIREVSREYGTRIGTNIRKGRERKGVAEVGQYLLRVFDMVSDDWEVAEFTGDRLVIAVSRCPYPFTRPEICAAHTEMEKALVASLDDTLDYRVGRSIPQGDPRCEHILEPKGRADVPGEEEAGGPGIAVARNGPDR